MSRRNRKNGDPRDVDVLVIGGGPGGYAAAFRAADLGLSVAIATDEADLGGVCLLRGCIPSKALLSLTEIILRARDASSMGIRFEEPAVDLEKLKQWRDQIVKRLSGGLKKLCQQRGIELIHSRARFEVSNRVRLTNAKDSSQLRFQKAIVATGSRPVALPGTEFQNGGRLLSSAGALELNDIPRQLLVVGGGYVGLELGMVYAVLGSRVTVVEMKDRLMPNADPDLVEPLAKRVEGLFEAVQLNTKVAGIEETSNGVHVKLQSEDKETEKNFDRALVAIGRQPNSGDVGLDKTQVKLNDRGFIEVDPQQRTADQAIFAVGDVTGGMLLAHEAMHEGKVAAEVIAGRAAAFDARAVPAVVYTDPQLAWCGLTEHEAREQKRDVEIARYPWRASGRALSVGSEDGMTKLILEPQSQRLLGMGIVGREAESLIAEGVLAIEMGAVAEDLALTIHPHPTLSETIGEAGETLLGSPTHLPPTKKSS